MQPQIQSRSAGGIGLPRRRIASLAKRLEMVLNRDESKGTVRLASRDDFQTTDADSEHARSRVAADRDVSRLSFDGASIPRSRTQMYWP
jgi:hypothetical protein